MDFRRSTRRIEIKPEVDNLKVQYPHNVILYKIPPIDDITIKEFEAMALERLRVLRILEHATSKNMRFLSDEWKEYVNGELSRESLKGYVRLLNGSAGTNTSKQESDLQARRRDYISHFILRLVYCRSNDLQSWFLSREMELFKYKFSVLTSAEISNFLEISKLDYVPLTEKQKNTVKDGLYESTFGQSVTKIELLDFYKVPFTQVSDLVRYRRCFIKDGFAYVNTNDFISVIAAIQQNEIALGLRSAQQFAKNLESDERLLYLLNSLHTSYTGKDFTLNKDMDVPIESLDQLSTKSFPLCMRVCHEHLRATHHHKHDGRLQYGLFLKGIGVTVEDSIRFWREEFTKKMDAETFTKRYEYGILYNYGKKGSMTNYSPFSCLKIIPQSSGPDQVHGCPFKMYDQNTLSGKLSNYGLSAMHVQDITNYSSKGHYQLACAKYFQIIHDSPVEPSISHPNQYFEESQILLGNKDGSRKSGAVVRKIVKSNHNSNILDNTQDDDELWIIAENQESEINSQIPQKSALNDDKNLQQELNDSTKKTME